MNRLGEFFTTRDNNFNLLRCLTALLVIYSHSWGLTTATESTEPLHKLLGSSMGALAVDIFFVISGYLVTQSWTRQRSLLNFCRARLLRVVPGLAGVLVLTLICAGLFWTTLDAGSFFRQGQTWQYFYKNLLMIKAEYDLPGVFNDNPYKDVVNGSLWTLRYEMKMYLSLAVLGLFGYLAGARLRLFVAAFALWFVAGSIAGELLDKAPISDEMLRLSLCFFLGGLAACFGQRLPLTGWALLPLLGLLLLARDTPFHTLSASLFLAYLVFCVAYLPRGRILGFNRVGDYSYGLYLYGCPIQQALVLHSPDMTPLPLFALASLLTLVCAIASWHLIEKPALDWCKRLNAASDRQRVAAAA